MDINTMIEKQSWYTIYTRTSYTKQENFNHAIE